MAAALAVLGSKSGRKVAVLGEMLELGDCTPAEHYRIGRLAAEKAALDLLSFAANGKIAVCSISLEQISAHNLASEDLDALIDIARSVAGVEVAFSIREEAEKSYRVSARSNSSIDVSSLCAHFGGGGHVKAAGCTVNAPDLEKAKTLIVERAERLIS